MGLMVQGLSGHQGASEVHLPAATGVPQFARTEALLRSLPGRALALTAALLPVGEPAQSARMVLLSTLSVGGPSQVARQSVRTLAPRYCALMAVSPAGVGVEGQVEGQAEDEMETNLK